MEKCPVQLLAKYFLGSSMGECWEEKRQRSFGVGQTKAVLLGRACKQDKHAESKEGLRMTVLLERARPDRSRGWRKNIVKRMPNASPIASMLCQVAVSWLNEMALPSPAPTFCFLFLSFCPSFAFLVFPFNFLLFLLEKGLPAQFFGRFRQLSPSHNSIPLVLNSSWTISSTKRFLFGDSLVSSGRQEKTLNEFHDLFWKKRKQDSDSSVLTIVAPLWYQEVPRVRWTPLKSCWDRDDLKTSALKLAGHRA